MIHQKLRISTNPVYKTLLNKKLQITFTLVSTIKNENFKPYLRGIFKLAIITREKFQQAQFNNFINKRSMKNRGKPEEYAKYFNSKSKIHIT